MARQPFSAEQIIHKLREADVALAGGTAFKQVCRQLNTTDKTYYRWQRECGGLKVDQAKRMQALETENARFERIVATRATVMATLKEVASGNVYVSRVEAWRLITTATRSGGPAKCSIKPAARSDTR